MEGNTQIIKTDSGNYIFQKKVFEMGTKVIDKIISKQNLMDFKKIMDCHKIKFSLVYGTLLGAIRENDFIAHDEDIDVSLLDEERTSFINLLFEFRENGFEVGRYEDDLLSLIRDGEYIDIYIFKKSLFGNRKCCFELLKEKYLINTIKYNFLDSVFDIPEHYIEFLEDHYGSDWKIPKKNAHACMPGLYLTVKLFLKKNAKPLFKIISWSKYKLHL